MRPFGPPFRESFDIQMILPGRRDRADPSLAGSLSRTRPSLNGAVGRALTIMLVALAASPAAAESARPRQGDFRAAVAGQAAKVVPAHTNEHQGGRVPAQKIAPSDQVRFEGRVIDMEGRFAGVLRVATSKTDANEHLAYRLFVVVLERDGGAFTPRGVVEIELGAYRYLGYETQLLKLARFGDVDDDGESELHVVVEATDEVQPGTGFCTARRSVIVDPGPGAPRVVANVQSSTVCECSLCAPRVEGTVLFRDADGDGHRDLVHRSRTCPEPRPDPEGGYVDVPCEPRSDTVYRWLPETDTYASP